MVKAGFKYLLAVVYDVMAHSPHDVVRHVAALMITMAVTQRVYGHREQQRELNPGAARFPKRRVRRAVG